MINAAKILKGIKQKIKEVKERIKRYEIDIKSVDRKYGWGRTIRNICSKKPVTITFSRGFHGNIN